MEILYPEMIGIGKSVNPYLLANNLRRRRLLSEEEYCEINHQRTFTAAQTNLFHDILPRKNIEDALLCLKESVKEIKESQGNLVPIATVEKALLQVQPRKSEISWNELDSFQKTMEMDEMKFCISEKAAQNTPESKEYVNSFILYGTDNCGDFMEIYPSAEEKKVQSNPDYKFYFGNQQPLVQTYPRGDNGDLKGISIALLPGAERYKVNAEINGQKLSIIYPQLTWEIAQAIKHRLESASATVKVIRDENVDPYTINFGRSTAAYFMQQVEAADAFFVVGIHFNVGDPNNANKDTWVDQGAMFEMQRINDVGAFVPGSYMQLYGELAKECDRFRFLRDIITRKMDESVDLADCIVRAMCDMLELPPRPQINNTMRLCPSTEGVFYRNLAYPRASKCPACYCSTSWIDNIDQFEKLVAGEYQDIVDGYCDGILEYVARKRFQL